MKLYIIIYIVLCMRGEWRCMKKFFENTLCQMLLKHKIRFLVVKYSLFCFFFATFAVNCVGDNALLPQTLNLINPQK